MVFVYLYSFTCENLISAIVMRFKACLSVCWSSWAVFVSNALKRRYSGLYGHLRVFASRCFGRCFKRAIFRYAPDNYST